MEKQILAIIDECKKRASEYASAYEVLGDFTGEGITSAETRKAIEIQHFVCLVNEAITSLTTAANTVSRTIAYGR
jgi:hypothetical protein